MRAVSSTKATVLRIHSFVVLVQFEACGDAEVSNMARQEQSSAFSRSFTLRKQPANRLDSQTTRGDYSCAMRMAVALAIGMWLAEAAALPQPPTSQPQESSSRPQPDTPPSPPDAPIPDQGAQTSPPSTSKAKKVANKLDPHCINVIFHTCWSSPQAPQPGHLSEEEQREQTATKDVEVGYFYLNEKNYRAAESRLQEATELKPDSAAAWVGLAQAQQNLGQNDAARRSYEQYLTLNPDGAGAEKARKALASLQQRER